MARRRSLKPFCQAAGSREQGAGNRSLAPTDPRSPTPVSWISWGQCIEHYGPSEPYLPILEALGRLGRGPDGEHLLAVLRQYAPTWLVHLPALLSPVEREQLQRQIQGTTPQRMLRELAEAIEALTIDRGLVLVLEDLHWSDVSSLTWLSFLARRREPARLLVLGTYWPFEMLGNGHPLRAVSQELQEHRQGTELRLRFLTEAHIAEYLTARLVKMASDRSDVLPCAPTQLARAMNDPFSLAFTQASAAQLHQYRREVPAAWERAEAAITVASEQGFAIPLAVGKTIRGWALSMQGGAEEGLVQLQDGVADLKATGTKNLLPYFLTLLAEAYGKAEQPEDGLKVLDETVAMINETGERWYEAELYRLRGELLLTQESKTQMAKIEQSSSP